jgi:hypothetical protein
LRGDPIQPLRIVDETHQGFRIARVGQQVQDGQADEKAVRRVTGPQTERRPERIALWTWNALQVIKEGRAELVQAGIRELTLGFDAAGPDDAASGRMPGQIVQQGGLADPRLATQDQHLALARPGVRQQLVECVALGASTAQHRPSTMT